MFRLLQCTLHGGTCEDNPEAVVSKMQELGCPLGLSRLSLPCNCSGLPIQCWASFIAFIRYKALYKPLKLYMAWEWDISSCHSAIPLWSSDRALIKILPQSETKRMAARCIVFSVMAPHLWNLLPEELRQSLVSQLFSLAVEEGGWSQRPFFNPHA